MPLGSSPHTRGALPVAGVWICGVRIIPAYAGSTVGRRWRRRWRPDHPRIRGEHVADCAFAVALAGSSPHTRGALGRGPASSCLPRIIPAYAGSTGSGSVEPPSAADHPRIRGEHGRVLGNLRPGYRIIPAYAGSTGRRRQRGRSYRDHPRIRGEHSLVPTDGILKPGSSPHTRGALANASGRADGAGIIPAYAGSTAGAGRPRAWSRDHPRIRGEHPPGGWRCPQTTGSSPHTRGARPPHPTAPSSTPDHPRIRGEHVPVGVQGAGEAGSSPHTRGAQRLTYDKTGSYRIIPAYAGSTTSSFMMEDRAWDHPRIRGEHMPMARHMRVGHGSSPHTRGALEKLPSAMARFRIIPAYAGGTRGAPPTP